MNIPHINGFPIIGSLPHFMQGQLPFMYQAWQQHGDVVRFRVGPVRLLLINHPDLIQEMLVAKADKFEKSPLDHAVFSRSMGNSILVSEGAFHKQQRKLMQPAFHHQRIAGYAQITTDFTQQMLAAWTPGETREMEHEMTRLTLFIISKALYNADVSTSADGVGEAIEVLTSAANDAYRTGMMPPKWLPIPQNWRVNAAIRQIDSVILSIIEARRAQGNIADKGDLLSMLLMAQDEDGNHMSDQQVRDEAVALFIAGHETTSNLMAWTFYALSQHPQVEAALTAELDAVLGGRVPTLADLPALKYTEQVIKEALRVYPSAWVLNGRAAQETVQLGDVMVDKGEVVYGSPYIMHHHPRYYENPDAFRPERWTPDFEKALPRYAYFPFGGGARVCIGNSFAMMEARLILATVAQRWRFESVNTPQLAPRVTLHAKDGICLRAFPRTPPPNGSPRSPNPPTPDLHAPSDRGRHSVCPARRRPAEGM
ncbi:MAG: cytochrome P450 [Blastochloris sp.]|nr:cytochrome P450 [Blastochloris sp.]